MIAQQLEAFDGTELGAGPGGGTGGSPSKPRRILAPDDRQREAFTPAEMAGPPATALADRS